MISWILGPKLSQKTNMLGSFTAALAFYFILSLVPFLIVTITAVTYFSPIDLTNGMATVLEKLFPPDAKLSPEAILKSVKRTVGGGTITFSFFFAVWTSFNFMNELVRTLHYIFSDPKKSIPSGWRTHLQSIALLFIWISTLISTAFFIVISPIILNAMQKWGRISEIASASWSWIGSFCLFVILFWAFYLTYRIIPVRTPSRGILRQASFLAAAGWLGMCALFAKVLPVVWVSNPFHGALGSIVATLMWAQACAWVVVIGACWIVRFD
jgi:membrane protein